MQTARKALPSLSTGWAYPTLRTPHPGHYSAEDIKDKMKKEEDQFRNYFKDHACVSPMNTTNLLMYTLEVDLQFGSVLSGLFKKQLFAQTYCLSIETGDLSQM